MYQLSLITSNRRHITTSYASRSHALWAYKQAEQGYSAGRFNFALLTDKHGTILRSCGSIM